MLVRMQSFAQAREDSDELRRMKQAIFVVASACSLAGFVWSGMYWLVFGWGLTAALPLAFTVIVGTALVVSHRTRNHYYAVYAQIVCIIYVTTLLQWSIGGVFDSGFVLAWQFVGPICALMFFSRRQAAVWLGLCLLNVALTVVFDDRFSSGVAVSTQLRHLFFLMNLGVSSTVVFIFASYFAHHAGKERARAEALQADLDLVGKKFGVYTLETKLGQGGMGVVYRARHALLRRSTAIKLLSSKENTTDLDRFEREVQLTSELSHPNIIAIYDYGRSDEGEFYYAMEYVPGIDLESLVRDHGPLEPARAIGILIQIADALSAAHAHGLIHRDIKPANVMISRAGHRADVVKVLDFGLVREVERVKDITQENVVCGTPAYLAPEALTDPDAVGPAGDLYALGAVAYFLLVGKLVFDAPTVPALYTHTLCSAPQPPSRDSPFEIPAALDAAILRCLEKSAADRFPSTAAFRAALEQVPLADAWNARRALAWWDELEARPPAEVRSVQPPLEPARGTVTVMHRKA